MGPVQGSEKVKKLARELLVARGAELVEAVKVVTKAKSGEARSQVLEVLETAVEIAYKSYFATGKVAFLEKIPRLTRAYEKILAGGNMKLQIVAELV